MSETETVCLEADAASEDVADKAHGRLAAARTALNEMRQRAQDAAERARARGREEILRRRTAAADRLETLAGALRPEHDARARRRTIAVAGGSTLALVAVLGVGVAVGMMLSRRLKRRAAARERVLPASDVAPSPPPGVDGPDSLATVGGLPH